MKVAIVHDWLVGGGAELVVLELHKMYPDAPIYTSYCSDDWRERLDDKVITGYLQNWPFSRYRKFLPILRQRWFKKLDLSEYDLVISSSGNGEAKFVTVNKPSLHVCYCHSPTHFYWRHYDYYRRVPGFGPRLLVRLALRLSIKSLRRRDYDAAQKVDAFMANSTHIQSDIKKFYNRTSVVVFPPVDVDRFNKLSKSKAPRRGFVTVGRQVPYKRVDLIVDACTQLDLPLTIIGRGPEHDNLVKKAGKNVTFLTNAGDDEVGANLIKAQAFIIAAFEDFGITPVEAIAAGTPVIAYQAGGALDYVHPHKTGEFFEEQTVDSLVNVLKNFDSSKYDPQEVSKSAQMFSREQFRARVRKFVSEVTRK